MLYNKNGYLCFIVVFAKMVLQPFFYFHLPKIINYYIYNYRFNIHYCNLLPIIDSKW